MVLAAGKKRSVTGVHKIHGKKNSCTSEGPQKPMTPGAGYLLPTMSSKSRMNCSQGWQWKIAPMLFQCLPPLRTLVIHTLAYNIPGDGTN